MDDWKERIAECGDNSLSIALTSALDELLARDRHLLNVDSHESAIAGALRGYLASRVGVAPEDGVPWDVDVDYNRRLATVKTIDGNRKVRPDLIVHRRNTDINLLAVELKKGSAPDADAEDMLKLVAYKRSLDTMGLGYQHSLFLRLGVKEDAGKVTCIRWA